MSDSTTIVDTISSSQSQKEVTANAVFDAVSQSMIFGRRASTTTALSWGYYGGRFTKADASNIAVANGVLTLTAAATNYIEVSSVGAVTSNTTAFTAGRTKLYTVVVGATTVTSYTDNRDGTQGNFLASASSVGTVTAGGGSLTANSLVLGAGGVDTKVVAGVVTDGISKLTLGVAGTSVGAVAFNNATSGSITVSPATGALGTVALTLPAVAGTLARTADITGTNSGTNTGDETTTTAGALIAGATSKTTPVDADYVGLMDSAASNVLKKLSWANLKATLKTYFDTLYAPITQPFDLAAFYPGLPTASAKVIRVPVARALSFAGDFAGSYFTASTNATATTVFDVQKNGSSIGSVSIASGGITATFTTTSGTAKTFVAGDVLMLVAPATPDATLADPGFVLVATR